MICAMSLAALTVLEAGPVETIRIAAACGYTHVGLRAVAATAAERHWPMLTDRALAADICRALDDHAMGVLDVEILRLTDAIDWDGVKAAIDYAAALGAGRVLVADNDPDPARSHDNLGRMGQIAQGAGVCVALEFMPWTCAPNLAAARTGGGAGWRGHAGRCVSSGPVGRHGGRCGRRGERGVLPPDVRHCRAGSADGRDPPGSARRPPVSGEGDVDLVGLLRACPHVPISLEIPADRLRLAGVGHRRGRNWPSMPCVACWPWRANRAAMGHRSGQCDLLVVGSGAAGLCAAVTGAIRGWTWCWPNARRCWAAPRRGLAGGCGCRATRWPRRRD
jgi:hypothetical protein